MDDPQRLNQLVRDAASAIASDPRRAVELLAEVEREGARHPEIAHLKGNAFLALKEPGGALAAYDAALVMEPYYLPSILGKGAALDDLGRKSDAAAVWRNALKVAPTAERLPPPLAALHARARTRVDEENLRLRDHLAECVEGVRALYGASELKRFDESLEIFAGRARAFHCEPTMLHFPALPPVSFFDRSRFPWFEDLEAASGVILEELEGLLASPAADAFAPYVAYPPGAPVNQWGELNRSRRWTSYFFFNSGARQAEACRNAPKTAALLEKLPILKVDSFGPTAMFSALAPRTRIPPHTGSTNVRAIVHLPLILPGPAWFRVGNDKREWRMGEAWAFDDTIEHEAMNESGETRVILICDAWNPYLTEPERTLVAAMLQAKSAYHARSGGRAERFT
ncbi:MAG TPA: aspartyl beta-hydroxylase [Parvularcula sp.]|nr:aspartyl beta-hydroxylase [Parvularcula sp.]HBS33415.1 aspartyl beta-hydroxylase [Parvularcula sp.]